MKNIIKSYVKSYFKNWIEAIGLIIFMLIIFAISTGLLSGPIQYQTEYNKIVDVSQKWDQSFNFDLNKSSSYFKSDFLVQLLTQETTNFQYDGSGKKWVSHLETQSVENFKKRFFGGKDQTQQWRNYQDAFSKLSSGSRLVSESIVDSWNKEALNKVNSLGLSGDEINIARDDYFNNLNKSIIDYFDQYHLEQMTTNIHNETPINEFFKNYGYDYRNLINYIILGKNQEGWSFNFMNNIYATPKVEQDTSSNEKNPVFFLSSSKHFTDSQPGVNNLKLYSGSHSMIKQNNSYFINYGSAYKNKINDTQSNWKPLGNQGPKTKTKSNFNLLGSALTLDTILAKQKSSIYEQSNGGGGGNPTSGIVGKYIGLYGTETNIQNLAAYLNGNYGFADASEIYYKIPSNFQGFQKAFSPFFNKMPFLNFNSSSIERLLQGINITTLLFVGITALLLLQGFIFINFTMKKEINKTKSQLGIFKAFGYRTSQLSWAFATKFFLTTFLGAVIGYAFGLLIQNFIAPQYTNSLYLPFVNLYAGPVFLTIYFLVIPILFTAISYLLTLYYLRQPSLKLMKGSIGRQLGIISRGIKVGLRKTNFIFRAQISFTLQSLGRFAAVMALFFFAILLLFIIFDSNALLNSTFKNLFDTYTNKVDHISKADSVSTDYNYNPESGYLELANKNPNAYKGTYYESYGQLNTLEQKNKMFQAAYTPDYGKPNYFGYTVKDLEKFLQGDKGSQKLPFWLDQLSKSSNPTVRDFLNKILTDVSKNPADIQKAINYILLVNYQLALQNPSSLKDVGDLSNQIEKVWAFLNSTPEGLSGVPSVDVLTHLVSTLNVFYSSYQSKDFPQSSGIWSDFSQIVKPSTAIFKPTIYKGISSTKTNRIQLGKAPSWFNKISLLSTQIINQKKTYLSFDKLYYQRGKELPEFQMALTPKNIPSNSNIKKIQAIGIDNKTDSNFWQQLYQFQGVSGSVLNQVLNQNFSYNPDGNNVLDAVVSNRIAALYKAKVGDTIPLSLNGGVPSLKKPPPKVSLKILGIAKNDTLSNNIYTSAHNLKQFYQDPLTGKGLSKYYFNSLVSENEIIPEHIDIQKFLAGKQIPKFALNTLGVSFLNPFNDPSNFKMANALGATEIDDQKATYYDVNNSTSSLIDPAKSLPISIIRQTGQQLLGNIKDVFAVIQAVIAVIVFVLFLVVISSIIDESIRIILTMRALGHRPRNINFIIIGNYVIGIIVFAILAYLVSVGIWLGVVQFVFTSFGILLTPPLGVSTPLIIAAIVAVILGIAWTIARGLIRTKSITQITAEE